MCFARRLCLGVRLRATLMFEMYVVSFTQYIHVLHTDLYFTFTCTATCSFTFTCMYVRVYVHVYVHAYVYVFVYLQFERAVFTLCVYVLRLRLLFVTYHVLCFD